MLDSPHALAHPCTSATKKKWTTNEQRELIAIKTKPIVLNHRLSSEQRAIFLNHSSSRVRSFVRARSDHFRAIVFFPGCVKSLFFRWTIDPARARVRLVSRNIWNPVRQNRKTTHQTTLWCYIPLQESGTREERGAFITPTRIWKLSVPFIRLKMRFLTRALKNEFDPKQPKVRVYLLIVLIASSSTVFCCF